MKLKEIRIEKGLSVSKRTIRKGCPNYYYACAIRIENNINLHEFHPSFPETMVPHRFLVLSDSTDQQRHP